MQPLVSRSITGRQLGFVVLVFALETLLFDFSSNHETANVGFSTYEMSVRV